MHCSTSAPFSAAACAKKFRHTAHAGANDEICRKRQDVQAFTETLPSLSAAVFFRTTVGTEKYLLLSR